MARKSDDDPLSRLEGLAKAGDFASLGEILCKENMPHVRRRSMELLFEMNNSDAFEILADVASGPENGLNEEILNGLKAKPGEHSLCALSRVLSSENSLRRAYTITLISQRDEAPALAMLLRGTRDPMKAVCKIAERALHQRVHRNPLALAKLPRESIAGIVAMMSLELAQELLDPKYPSSIRAEASRRLAVASGAEAVTTLMSLSSDSDPILATAAWEGLNIIKDLPATFLLPYLADRRDEFRRQGLELFSKTCGRESVPIVAGLLKDPSAGVREEAIRTLHKLLGDESTPMIKKLMGDPEVSVRRVVLRTFLNVNSARAEIIQMVAMERGPLHDAALIVAARKEIFVKELADDYLAFLERHSSETSQTSDVIDAMAAIAKILGEVNEPRALSGFAALCKTTSRRLRRIGIESVLAFPESQRGDILASLVDTHDRAMLASLALALALAKDHRATIPLIRTYMECGGRPAKSAGEYLQNDSKVGDVDVLIKFLSNQWASVRRFAAEKLKNSKDDRVIDPLLKASEDEDTEVQLASIEALSSFAKNHQQVAERLIHACSQGDITVRQAAVEALGNAQIVEAVPNLIKALHNIFLRPRATEALKKVGGRQGYLALKRLQRRELLFGNRNKAKKVKKKMLD
ncbi:MAG: HEAT repeat domain-containing protein [Planctomycetes bacterium]|nr:HEAT repeat domain-containing protein [Planctomycetota bacterium]